MRCMVMSCFEPLTPTPLPVGYPLPTFHLNATKDTEDTKGKIMYINRFYR
jgi:hypothetical protein